MTVSSVVRVVAVAVLISLSGGCKSTYYSVWEKLGYEKRDILVSKVKDARDDQEAAKKQFQTTLERFQDVTHFNGGDLEVRYKKLSSEYDACEARAADVNKRIQSVEDVASDLFKEWQEETKEYTDPDLRRSSEQKLEETRARYEKFIGIMKTAAGKMHPVLAAFKDQVLYLKHNLDAQAIASLQTTSAGIESDVGKLIQDMQASIDEANAFIGQMK